MNEHRMESAQQFLETLKEEILQHPFLSSPFVERMAAADPLTLEQAQAFARLYYPHIVRTRLYQANALGITPDEKIQYVLATILYDEYGNGDSSRSHTQLYRRFMTAVGVTPAKNPDSNMIPELRDYIDEMTKLTQQGPWISALGAVGIASEWPIPAYYEKILRGLQTVPGITSGDLELFSGHITLDLEHSGMMERVLLPYLNEVSNRDQLKTGIAKNLNLRTKLMSALYSSIFT